MTLIQCSPSVCEVGDCIGRDLLDRRDDQIYIAAARPPGDRPGQPAESAAVRSMAPLAPHPTDRPTDRDRWRHTLPTNIDEGDRKSTPDYEMQSSLLTPYFKFHTPEVSHYTIDTNLS